MSEQSGFGAVAKRVVEGFVTTSAPTPKYGGIVFAARALQTVAAEFRQLEYMTIDHDSRERVPIRVLDSELRQAENGTMGVWVRYEVDEAHWRQVGGRMGFSISVIVPLLRPDPNSDKPVLSIVVEAGQFDEQAVTALVESLRPYANVKVGLLFQFSEHVEFARVAIELAITTLQSLGANGLYDALRHLLGRDESSESAPIVFDIRIHEEHTNDTSNRIVSARLETNNSEDLSKALAVLEGAIRDGGEHLSYDPGQRRWGRLR